MAQNRGWTLSKRREVLAEFVRAIDEQDFLGFAVAVDTNVWGSLKSKQRKVFGTASDFCFQRLMRIVFDRLEVAKELDAIVIDLDICMNKFERRSKAVRALFNADSRASFRVGSVQFSDPNRYCHLQAAKLLTCMTKRSLAVRTGTELHMPQWLKNLPELPDPQDGIVCEYWDRAYSDKYFASIEWLVSEGSEA